jgi:outer membrane protein assembly factor BamA
LYVGYSNLVRGYEIGSFGIEECGGSIQQRCDLVDNLIGSRVFVTNVELRAPLVGAFTGRLEYGPIPAELIGFFDAGVAWDSETRPKGFGNGTRSWARSFGAGVRINALGYLVLELAGVRALDRPDDGWRFVFGIRPGF